MKQTQESGLEQTRNARQSPARASPSLRLLLARRQRWGGEPAPSSSETVIVKSLPYYPGAREALVRPAREPLPSPQVHSFRLERAREEEAVLRQQSQQVDPPRFSSLLLEPVPAVPSPSLPSFVLYLQSLLRPPSSPSAQQILPAHAPPPSPDHHQHPSEPGNDSAQSQPCQEGCRQPLPQQQPGFARNSLPLLPHPPLRAGNVSSLRAACLPCLIPCHRPSLRLRPTDCHRPNPRQGNGLRH